MPPTRRSAALDAFALNMSLGQDKTVPSREGLFLDLGGTHGLGRVVLLTETCMTTLLA